MAARSCGQKLVGAYQSSNLWTPAVQEAVRLKKEAVRAWLAREAPDAADMYRRVRWAVAPEVAVAKSVAWKEFGEATESDFRPASKRFWGTIWRLRRGRTGLAQSVLRSGDPLTSNGDIVER